MGSIREEGIEGGRNRGLGKLLGGIEGKIKMYWTLAMY